MKLRRKIAYGLCVFYLLSVIGIALSLHFCSGKLSSVDFAAETACKMCKGDESKKLAKDDTCCKNHKVEAKVTDKHQVGEKVNMPKNFSITLFLAPIIADYFQSLLPTLFSSIENKAPPLSSRISLHVFNCVFRN